MFMRWTRLQRWLEMVIDVTVLTPREVNGACGMFPRDYSLAVVGERVLLEANE